MTQRRKKVIFFFISCLLALWSGQSKEPSLETFGQDITPKLPGSSSGLRSFLSWHLVFLPTQIQSRIYNFPDSGEAIIREGWQFCVARGLRSMPWRPIRALRPGIAALRRLLPLAEALVLTTLYILSSHSLHTWICPQQYKPCCNSARTFSREPISMRSEVEALLPLQDNHNPHESQQYSLQPRMLRQ